MTDRPNIHDIEAMDDEELIDFVAGMWVELCGPRKGSMVRDRLGLQRLALELANELRARDVDRGPWREDLAALEPIKSMIENQQPLPADAEKVLRENLWDLYVDEAAEGEE